MSIMGLESALLGAWAAGLRNLLVITGDPSQLGDYAGAFDVAQTDSVGLTRIITDLCRGLDWAGNPVGDPPRFALGVAVNPNAEDMDLEIERFRKKIAHGAHFAMSQVFFDYADWERFWDRFGGPSPIPVMVGIWPVSSFRLALRLEQEVPGIHVPEAFLKKLQDAGPDARKLGWDHARAMLERAKALAQGTYLIAPYKQPEDILALLD
jgi:homocysteine S-methyltransferase